MSKPLETPRRGPKLTPERYASSALTTIVLNMKPHLPQRSSSHQLESWSKARFGMAVPSEWVVRWIDHDDYGIDARIELFESGETTGFEFALQLKSTATTRSPHFTTIKRQTLNYWASLNLPVLVILADQATDTLWYEWSHLLPFDEHSSRATRRITFVKSWNKGTPAELYKEAQAHRFARELHRHLPLKVAALGLSFYGEDSGPLFVALRTALRGLPDIQVVHSEPEDVPYISVTSADDAVRVRLTGDHSRSLTWGHPNEYSTTAAAADIVTAIAFAVGECGAEDLGGQLLERAVPDSMMLIAAGRLSDAMAVLTRRNSWIAVELIKKTYAVENHPHGPEALVGFANASSRATPELRKAVLNVIEDASRTWINPGPGLYNTGNLTAADDPNASLALYEECAHLDPSYLDRGYWWREKGTLHWRLDEKRVAEENYREAIARGDKHARAYLADALMRTGRYAEAKIEFENADITSSPFAAQWRLSYAAVAHITDNLSIESQDLNAEARSAATPAAGQDSVSAATRAIEYNALDPWAQWALCPPAREAGESALLPMTVAAVSALTIPAMWQELVLDAFNEPEIDDDTRASVIHDALMCAKQYCEEAFNEMILTDPIITPTLRELLIALWQELETPSQDLHVRDYGSDRSL